MDKKISQYEIDPTVFTMTLDGQSWIVKLHKFILHILHTSQYLHNVTRVVQICSSINQIISSDWQTPCLDIFWQDKKKKKKKRIS